MELEPLDSITRLSERVVRILGQNPGKFTLQGTNTYLIGRRNPYILLDTGEGKEEYISVLESALHDVAQPSVLDQPVVSDIIISHRHHDHVGGLPSVLALLHRLWKEKNSTTKYKPPRLHKFPLPTPDDDLQSIVASLQSELYSPSPDGSAFHDLSDGQMLTDSDASPLHILHTPGHTKDSICIRMPQDSVLFTADTVLGFGTAVFEDLGTYMNSLSKILRPFSLQDSTSPDSGIALYPGHGPVVTQGSELITTYIQHRLEREKQVVEVLAQKPSQGETWTTWSIVKTIYAAYPESLWLPAAQSIDLHLRKLEGDGRVQRLGGDGKDAEWQLLAKL